jgi:hypothetical protein
MEVTIKEIFQFAADPYDRELKSHGLKRIID